MGDRRGGDERGHLVPVLHAVEALEDPFALSEQDGHEDEVKLVDEAGLQVLPDRGGPAADADVLPLGGREGLLEGRLDAARAKSSSMPSLPPSRPNIALKNLVAKAQSMSFRPFLPKGASRD
jgi:hypothetical protein